MKKIIFDLGAVLIEWNPAAVASGFTDDLELQKRITNDIYVHQLWAEFDLGLSSETETQQRISELLAIDSDRAELLIQHTKQSLNPIPRSLEILMQCKDLNIPAYCLSNIPLSFLEHLKSQYAFFRFI